MPSVRRIAPALVGGAVAALATQVAYVTRRNLPSFGNMDASAELGDPAAPPLRITAYGDSSLTGPGLADPSEIWIRQAIEPYAADRLVILRSRAVGGATAPDVLESQLPGHPPTDVAVVAAGSNDALHGLPLRRVEQAFAEIVRRLLAEDAIVVLTGVGDLGTIPRLPPPLAAIARARGRQLDAVQARLAARNPRVFKVPIWPSTATTFRTEPDTFAGDLFHANARGHAIWANAFGPTLRIAVDAADRDAR